MFAIGTLLDLTTPPYSPEADTYFDLGVAALSLHPIFSSTDTGTVQALLMVAVYLNYGGHRFSLDGSWSVVSLAAKLAQSVCLPSISRMAERTSMADWSSYVPRSEALCRTKNDNALPDRENEQWHLDPKTLDRRRRLFWDLYSFDLSLVGFLGSLPLSRRPDSSKECQARPTTLDQAELCRCSVTCGRRTKTR